MHPTATNRKPVIPGGSEGGVDHETNGQKLPAAIEILTAAGFDADYVHADIGWESWCREGNPLPDRTIELFENYKIGLFGAIRSKPKTDAAKELAPELQDQGLVH